MEKLSLRKLSAEKELSRKETSENISRFVTAHLEISLYLL